jgi:hypothetical protein
MSYLLPSTHGLVRAFEFEAAASMHGYHLRRARVQFFCAVHGNASFALNDINCMVITRRYSRSCQQGSPLH